jgi:hypothetical protein
MSAGKWIPTFWRNVTQGQVVGDKFLGLLGPDGGELCSCKMSLTIYQLTQCIISEDFNVDQHLNVTFALLFNIAQYNV